MPTLCPESRSVLHDDACYVAVLDNLSDGVVLLDSDAEVLLWNKSIVRLTGVAAALAVGARLSDLPVPQPLAAIAARLYTAALIEGETFETVETCLAAGTTLCEWTARRMRHGPSLRVLLTVRESAGPVGPWRGNVSDIEALGRTACVAVHDFNNVLTGIMAHAFLLKQAVGDMPQAAEHAERIERSVEKGAELTTKALEAAHRLLNAACPRAPLSLREKAG